MDNAMVVIELLLKVIDRLISLETYRSARKQKIFETIFEPCFEDLRTVHQDYIQMFREIQRKVPPPFTRGDPAYREKLMSAAEQLRETRTKFAPVRVELRRLAENLQRQKLDSDTHRFAEALLNYFPDGSLRDSGQTRGNTWWTSASTTLLDRIHEDLSDVHEHDAGALIQETLVTLETAWSEVCDAYQALRLQVRMGGR